MTELSDAKIPALFIVSQPEQVISVKNTNDDTTSLLIMDYLKGSEERQIAFLEVLENSLIPNESTEQPTADGTAAE